MKLILEISIARHRHGMADRELANRRVIYNQRAVRCVEARHGNLIAARVVINPYAEVGQHCLIQSGAVIESQAKIGDYVQIGTGSIINSGVTIEEGAFIGTGATLVAGVTIGKNARVGAGSVVVESVEAGATVFGNPAKKL